MIERLRAWARRTTDCGRYTPVGIAFHWIMAFLVLFQLGWGWYTGFLWPGGDKLFAYQVHSAAGLPVLLLAVGRVIWRLMIPGPYNDADTQGWQSTSAYAIHYLFYLCFFGLPLSGWAMWSSVAEPGPLYLAGAIPWPRMPFEELPLHLRWSILDWAEDAHFLLVWLLALIVPLHVGAALKHHFWDHHDVLRGILPEVPDAEDPREAGRHSQTDPQSPLRSNAG
jgi:cytochrome b561